MKTIPYWNLKLIVQTRARKDWHWETLENMRTLWHRTSEDSDYIYIEGTLWRWRQLGRMRYGWTESAGKTTEAKLKVPVFCVFSFEVPLVSFVVGGWFGFLGCHRLGIFQVDQVLCITVYCLPSLSLPCFPFVLIFSPSPVSVFFIWSPAFSLPLVLFIFCLGVKFTS